MTISKNEILEMLNTAKSDLDIWVGWLGEDDISVDVVDFIGRNRRHGKERKLDNPEQVDHIRNTLKANANDITIGEWYTYYHFNDCIIRWGYKSLYI